MLIFLFILAPLIEIVVLIEIGSIIGAWWTIFLIILTAVIGLRMLKIQGLDTFIRFQATVARGEVPAFELLEGLLLLLSGAFLLTPGFVTDLIGFLCLFRPSRMLIIHTIAKSDLGLRGQIFTPRSRRKGNDIEGTFRRRDEDDD